MKQWFSIVALCLLSLASTAQVINYQGTVINTNTFTPLTGATVTVTNGEAKIVTQTTTNIEGYFEFQISADENYTLLVSFVGYESYSQPLDNNKEKLHIQLRPYSVHMGQVVISSLYVPQLEREATYPVGVVTPETRLAGSYTTVSDLAGTTPGVSVAKDGAWGTSVNIRGQNEQRIVTLINGNRVETATDLYAGLSMLIPSSIKQIEIIKGASSVLHGSGAMGGIINLLTHSGHFAPSSYINGQLESTYDNVNKAFGNHLHVTAGNKNWYLHTGVSMRKADDMETPEGELTNSQYEDKQLNIATGISFGNQSLEATYQNYNANDVGIPGGAPLPGPATATYTNADRQMADLAYTFKPQNSKLHYLKVNYFYQSIIRDVEMLPNIPPKEVPGQRITPERITPSGNHYTQGLKAISQWNWSDRINSLVGIDGWQRRLETSREKYIRIDVLDEDNNIIKTNNMIRGENPIPEARFRSTGIFTENNFTLAQGKAHLAIGGRIDNIYVENEKHLDPLYLIMNGNRNDTPPNQRLIFPEDEYNDISWSVNAGMRYEITPQIHINYQIARAFRSASLEERFKYIDLGSKVRLGNPNLVPEQSFSNDLSFRFWFPNWQFSVSAYANWLEDLITETPGEFIYTYYAGETELRDTLPALVNNNVNKARYVGIDLKGRVRISQGWIASFTGAWVRGEDTENNTDLPMIAPMQGQIALTYKHRSIGSLRVALTGVAEQTHIAEGETTTAGYGKTDLNYQSPEIILPNSHVQFIAGIDNLFDKAYTNHLATNRGSINIEPGRNIYVRALFNF